MSTPASDQAYADHLWSRRWQLVYKTRLSVLYHLKRARFFDSFDKVASIVTALAATSAAVVILQQHAGLEKCFALATAALSLVPIIYNPAQHARDHTELVSRFRALLAQMHRAGEQWSEDECNRFAAELVEIEVAEPAALGALVAECQNELGLSMPEAQRARLVKLKLYQRLLKHWWPFDASQLQQQA